MFTDLVLGRREGPHRMSSLWVAIICNWVGLFVALSRGWYVGVPIMVGGMVLSGVVSRRSAEPARTERDPSDLVDRVHARLAAGEPQEAPVEESVRENELVLQ